MKLRKHLDVVMDAIVEATRRDSHAQSVAERGAIRDYLSTLRLLQNELLCALNTISPIMYRLHLVAINGLAARAVAKKPAPRPILKYSSKVSPVVEERPDFLEPISTPPRSSGKSFSRYADAW